MKAPADGDEGGGVDACALRPRDAGYESPSRKNYVCVRVYERERESARVFKRERERERDSVCVCMTERERAREREGTRALATPCR